MAESGLRISANGNREKKFPGKKNNNMRIITRSEIMITIVLRIKKLNNNKNF